jgi:hypothetical protein
MSYELIADWIRRLTRTSSLFCTFARHSWIASLSKIAGAANEN